MQALRSHDQVYIRGLRRDIVVGRDAWGRSGKEQPVIINARIYTANAVKDAAQTDDIALGIDYSKLCKTLGSLMTNSESLHALAQSIATQLPHHDNITLEITLPRGVPHSPAGITYTTEYLLLTPPSNWRLHSLTALIPSLQVSCIIGIHPHERTHKQPISISLSFGTTDSRPILTCYQEVAQAVFDDVESSQYQTVEALAERVARTVTTDFEIYGVTVGVEKPAAIPGIETPGVKITRRKGFWEERKS
ncbi:MAG: hypothetical protein Q9160_005498 [Pyrenula sp. 1 TL-2023]